MGRLAQAAHRAASSPARSGRQARPPNTVKAPPKHRKNTAKGLPGDRQPRAASPPPNKGQQEPIRRPARRRPGPPRAPRACPNAAAARQGPAWRQAGRTVAMPLGERRPPMTKPRRDAAAAWQAGRVHAAVGPTRSQKPIFLPAPCALPQAAGATVRRALFSGSRPLRRADWLMGLLTGHGPHKAVLWPMPPPRRAWRAGRTTFGPPARAARRKKGTCRPGAAGGPAL